MAAKYEVIASLIEDSKELYDNLEKMNRTLDEKEIIDSKRIKRLYEVVQKIKSQEDHS